MHTYSMWVLFFGDENKYSKNTGKMLSCTPIFEYNFWGYNGGNIFQDKVIESKDYL